jgi:hypothetical protein
MTLALGFLSDDFFTAAGKSSASMFCHFNSSRAIVLLQLGQTEKGTQSSVGGMGYVPQLFTQIRDQRRVVPGARAIPTGCRCSGSSLWVINSRTAC